MTSSFASTLVTMLCASAALVWFVIARQATHVARAVGIEPPLRCLLPAAAGCAAVYYAFLFGGQLIPRTRPPAPAPGFRIIDLIEIAFLVALIPIALHAVRHFVRRPPSWLWVAATYAAPVLLLTAGAAGLVSPAVMAPLIAVYFLVVMIRTVHRLLPVARHGGWQAGSIGVPRRADLVLLVLVIGLFIALVTLLLSHDSPRLHTWKLGLVAAIGLAAALPSTTRMLGGVLRGILSATVMLGGVGAVLLACRVAARSASAELQTAIDVAAVAVLALLVLPGHAWVEKQIDRRLLRRSYDRRAALQGFLHTLSPEHGVRTCCELAVAAVARIMRLPGAAILLADGERIGCGNLSSGLWWPDDVPSTVLPRQSVVGIALHDLHAEVRECLIEAGVVTIVPIASPRRQWGHLLSGTTFLGSVYETEDVDAVVSFAAELALVLDGADLLARAVAVERSLVHAEKLAAIGETAARIAHDIRNPVTAARSLAQQLSRAPTAPDNAEYAALILAELERVEHQVASLLRFSRRDEYHFESIDVGKLVGATIESIGGRAAAAHVAVESQVADSVIARADAEKIRGVLLNLFENALDAASSGTGEATMRVRVSRINGHAHVTIADNGPGVPADALPHLFEPFFSLKEKGTGLGLAIAKRTIEAHGGRIEVLSIHPGMAFDIELPLAQENTEHR